MRIPTMWDMYVRPAKAQIACAQTDQSLCWSLEYYLTVKLVIKHHFEFLTFKGGYTGSSESTLIKMPHCWKSNVEAKKANQTSFKKDVS